MRNSDTPRQVDSGCQDVLRSARLLLRLCWGGCARCAPVLAVLFGAFALGVRPYLRFCRGGLLGARPALRLCRGFLPRFTPVFFPLSGKKRRLAVSCVPVPPGRDRHSRVFVVSVRLSALAGSFRACAFLYGDLDGLPGRGDGVTRGDGVGGAAFVRLCAAASALICFPLGERWGCAPQTAPKSLRLSGLSSRCGGVALVRIPPRRHPGTIGDLTGSNLWPGRSCGRSNIAVRTIA